MKRKITICLLFVLLILPAAVFVSSCSEDNSGLAGPDWNTRVSKITVEANFKPAITWVGGYASVIGVNRGSSARLDTSLVWLIKSNGDNISFHNFKYGNLPQGSADITSQFGGRKADSLSEDETYTFWVMKEDVWAQVSSQPGRRLVADSTLSSSVISAGDSIRINPFSFGEIKQALDVYVNITNLATFGRLGIINIAPTNSDKPVISWTITQSGETDPKISAIGLVEGQQYLPAYAKWDMYSETDSSGTMLYGRENIISSPIQAGTSISGAKTFIELPAEGLQRGKEYYVWIANKTWNRSSRGRTINGYAYATFKTE